MQTMNLQPLQSNAPAATFVVGCLIFGSLINNFPPSGEKVTPGVDFKCPEDLSSPQSVSSRPNSIIASKNSLLPNYAVTVITVFLPLLPMFAPSIISGKSGNTVQFVSDIKETSKLFLSHIAGQSGSFSTSEFGRFFILKPNLQFFRDCHLSGEECRRLQHEDRVSKRDIVGQKDQLPEKTSVVLPEERNTTLQEFVDTFVMGSVTPLCPNTSFTYTELYKNLHGFPDVSSALVGAAFVSFFLAMFARQAGRKKAEADTLSKEENKVDHVECEGTEKDDTKCWEKAQYAKQCLKVVFVGASSVLLVVLLLDIYSQTRSTPTDVCFSVFLGAILQLMTYFFVSFKDFQR